ncbi:unnamed protein product, partial [marine sediment metagenome]
ANPPTISPAVEDSPYPVDRRSAALAGRIIKETGVTAGYCLQLGSGDGRLAYDLAKRSDLNIYCIEPDAEKVAAARKALDAAGLYGVRVTVHQGSLDKLAYPAHFANLIVSGSGFSPDLGAAGATEMYRVLRPCGGVAYLAAEAAPSGQLAKWASSGGVPAREMRTSAEAARIVRGALRGAGEWTHQYADAGKSGCSNDQLVKWPLKLLWFGKPGPAHIISRHWKPSAPVSINGRLFVAGQHTIIAVDAYNGYELWATDLPAVGRMRVSSAGGNFAADADSVYAATGSVCFRLDAETGEIQQLYRIPTRAARFVLDQPRTFELNLDDKHSGTVTIQATAEGLVARLVTVDDNVTNLHREDNPSLGDCWELFFDLRPAAERGGLYGQGTFQILVVPATTEEDVTSYKPGAGSAHPELTVAGALTDTG